MPPNETFPVLLLGGWRKPARSSDPPVLTIRRMGIHQTPPGCQYIPARQVTTHEPDLLARAMARARRRVDGLISLLDIQGMEPLGDHVWDRPVRGPELRIFTGIRSRTGREYWLLRPGEVEYHLQADVADVPVFVSGLDDEENQVETLEVFRHIEIRPDTEATHWLIKPDLSAHPESLTFVSGAGQGRLAGAFARTERGRFRLEELASPDRLDRLRESEEAVVSIEFAEEGLTLDEREYFRRMAYTTAQLVRCADAPRTMRIIFTLPQEELFLAVRDAVEKGAVTPEAYRTWIDRVTVRARLVESHIEELCAELLGEERSRVDLSFEYGLDHAGRQLRARALDPAVWGAVESGLRHRFGDFGRPRRDLAEIDRWVALLRASSDSDLTIAVDDPDLTDRLMVLAEAFAPAVIGRPPRMLSLSPLPKIVAASRGASGPFEAHRGDPGDVIISDDPASPQKVERVPFVDLLRRLYPVPSRI